jgi:hypothetical protein
VNTFLDFVRVHIIKKLVLFSEVDNHSVCQNRLTRRRIGVGFIPQQPLPCKPKGTAHREMGPPLTQIPKGTKFGIK